MRGRQSLKVYTQELEIGYTLTTHFKIWSIEFLCYSIVKKYAKVNTVFYDMGIRLWNV